MWRFCSRGVQWELQKVCAVSFDAGSQGRQLCWHCKHTESQAKPQFPVAKNILDPLVARSQSENWQLCFRAMQRCPFSRERIAESVPGVGSVVGAGTGAESRGGIVGGRIGESEGGEDSGGGVPATGIRVSITCCGLLKLATLMLQGSTC